ncbi:MAG TPA: pantetheine-phosphate adenylyltransferase [Candidatus Atribacteria bacterium]|jgi:pantetheine-phosphate adenylyltransferase|nr:pantetheine-phosphate adenylyltransferase [Atribacterota bacterium]HOA99625.1 pantetheine-phosphate adenylyltransferase [Candidatus Atribacteria bacterium]MDI9608617.1 pantetheine-phosphate adenylyltransferase [Atribacterota bacterium]HOQ50468.1 pantetheine-phosphate adenylyltransferase [Candidatus Atribacteria bacterium]HPT64124.1 pantetheine-phosphate adenylyltransferase [Candidatus Atribacteria bacterium]
MKERLTLIAIYPGSFDPLTNGHLDVIERGRKIFDRLVVGILKNPHKQPLFTSEERKTMIEEAVKPFSNVEVEIFDGLLVNFARERGCQVILRGLRAISDYEYETQIALINRKMAPEIETLFLPTSAEFSYLNSTIVKEIASFGGCIRGLVPPAVEKKLRDKFDRGNLSNF